jgi:hypothetical protein
VFLHCTLDRRCIEVGGDFLHKTPRVVVSDADCVREGMLASLHKVVFLQSQYTGFPAASQNRAPGGSES